MRYRRARGRLAGATLAVVTPALVSSLVAPARPDRRPPASSGSAAGRLGPDEAEVIRAAARRAEDAGDLAGAARLVAALAADDQTRRWAADLRRGRQALADGPDATARWLLQPATRWGLTSPHAARWLALGGEVLRARGLPAAERARGQLGCLWVEPAVRDAGLFELGILDSYLTSALAPDVLAQAPFLARWSGCPVSVWEVADDGRVRDLASGREEHVDSGGQDGPGPPGELLYGRLVPLAAGVGFALPPVVLGRLEARRVLRCLARASPLTERMRALTPRRPTGQGPA